MLDQANNGLPDWEQHGQEYRRKGESVPAECDALQFGFCLRVGPSNGGPQTPGPSGSCWRCQEVGRGEDSKLKAASYGEPVGEHAKRRGNFRPQVAPSGKLCRTQKRVTLVLKCHAWGLQGRQLDRVVKCILLDHTTNPSTLTLHLVVKCILLDHTLEKEQEFQCYDAALLLRLGVTPGGCKAAARS
eukprot:scaffold78818_cov23-Tisochrysis_lutea.AAC.1